MADVLSGPGGFRVEISRRDATVRLAVRGDLDLRTGPLLHHALEEQITDDLAEAVLDLRGVDFTGSTGVALVLLFEQLARERGVHATVVRGKPAVQRVLELAGVTHQATFVDAP